MKIDKLWFKACAVLFFIIAMASCQDDLNTIGSEILGDEPPTGTLDDSHTVIAFSRKMNPVQSNRLPAYQLGVYNEPTYGKSSVNLLSQLTLRENNPTFGDSAVVDSVFVYLPYYSTETVVDSTVTYTTDSIYGTSPIKVSIYESRYYLREYDPASGFEEAQPYYSNQGAMFEDYLGEKLGEIESFKPSSEGYLFPKEDEDPDRLAPGLRVKLDSLFFQQRIIEKEGGDELRNNTNFRDYFRGLYFKVESETNDGSLFIFDPSEARVSVYYSYLPEDSDDRKNKVFDLSLNGVRVNVFDNAALPQHITNSLENTDEQYGEEALYLRGGDGIMTVVNLFGDDDDGDGVSEELELLRSKEWLINEANLIFYVDQDRISGGSTEPDRITIYNLRTNTMLADFNVDPTGGLPAAQAYVNHLGKLERGSDDKGKYYKIKITDHISDIINKDSINAPLGVVVSQNVSLRTFQKLEESQEPTIEKIPSSAVVAPKGTVLHGNKSPNEDKKLKLQIFYTEPK